MFLLSFPGEHWERKKGGGVRGVQKRGGGVKEKELTEKGEDVGVALGVVRVHDLLGELADGGLDLSLGLDSGDRQRGDEWERAEDDEGDKCRGVHPRGDLRSPGVEDGLAIVCLAALKVVIEPTATDDVECGNGGPVG